MKKYNDLTMNQRALIVAIIISAILTIALVTISRRINISNGVASDIKTGRLADACLSRWKYNEKYAPPLPEINRWIDTIYEYDWVLNDPIFYCSLIDLESGGDPTTYIEKVQTQGLGCIAKVTARHMIQKYGLTIIDIEAALYNPYFNIFCMVKAIEDLHGKSDEQDARRYALMCYYYGEAGYKKRRDSGTVTYRYYEMHAERVKEINRLMKGAGK